LAKLQEQDEADINPSYDVSPEERRKAFRKMLSYAKPHRRSFFVIFVFTVIAVFTDLLQPYLVKVAIDSDALSGRAGFQLLIIIGLSYFGLAIITMLFSLLQANLLQRTGQNIVAQLRKDLFHHISRLSMSFFDRTHVGSLVTNESSDTETINQFFTQVLLSLMRDVLTLVLIFGFMFYLDATLALYCLLILPVIAVISALFRSKLRSAYQRVRTHLSRLIAYLAENLSGMGLIQAFHQEKEQGERFTKRNRRYLTESLREVGTTVLFNRTFDVFGNLAVAAVVWIGGIAVFDQHLSFGVLYAFINYIRQFFQPINQITQQWNTFQSTLVSTDRLWRIFKLEPEVQEPDQDQMQTLASDRVVGRVDFNQIRFGYGENADVLHDLDFHVEAGEFIGIVGTTGAGKSSLVNLLTRFYDVRQGSVCIDGVDIRKLPLETLNRMVGLVQQEPFLYSGSILDNVRLFDVSISREAVIEACRLVGAGPMIERLPGGYDTRLTERGSGLAAGERQLISFARIVVFQPKILILDEATANLDSHTEVLIQHALEQVSQGRTTLVIAHRLSTIQSADRIIVMKHGRIVEEGSHEGLVEKKGDYAELLKYSRIGEAETAV